ncbi:MAG TPA: hypothetical protein DCX97_06060 [Alistipes sp.]|nr:hypothetical protein [Alistipes sp.]
MRSGAKRSGISTVFVELEGSTVYRSRLSAMEPISALIVSIAAANGTLSFGRSIMPIPATSRSCSTSMLPVPISSSVAKTKLLTRW